MRQKPASHALVALIPVAAAFLLHGPLLDWDLKIGDEGYLVYGVERLADGEVLYRDVLRHYMPGVYYMFVPLFEWLGPSLWTVRAVWLGWLALMCGGVCLLLRPLAPPWIAVLAGLVTAFVPPPLHKTFVPAMTLLGLACCRSLLRESISFRRAVAVGAGFGVVALFRQEVAVFCVGIGAVTVGVRALASPLPRLAMRTAAGAALGVAIVWAPVLVAFAAAGALGAMFDQVVRTASAANAGVGLPFPAAFPFYFPGAAAALGLAIAATALWRRRFEESHALLLQWAVLAALMHVLVAQRSDVHHLTQIFLAPTLAVGGAMGLCGSAALKNPPLRWPAVAGGALLAIALLSLGGWGLATRILPDYREKARGVRLEEPRARVVLDRRLADEARSLLAYIREQTRPGEPIFVAPYSPMYYFLAERPNPTRHDFVLPVTTTPLEQREIRDALDQARVRLVLIRDVPIDGLPDRRFPRYAPRLADYLAAEYETDRRIGSWLCLVRREPSRPAR